MVGDLGAIAVWRLAIKPGRPLAIGRIGRTPFIGVPGNPVAAFVTFARVVRPLLALLCAEAFAPESFTVLAGFSHRKRRGPLEYVRVTVSPDADGRLVAAKHPVEGAAVITSLTQTTGLVELAASVADVGPGDPLIYLPYASLL